MFDVSIKPGAGHLLAWAETESPDVALVIASGYLSNGAKDGLADYKRNRRPPFRVRHWERPTLARMLADHPGLLDSHQIFIQGMRTSAQILAAEQEFFDKVWYVRQLIRQEKAAFAAGIDIDGPDWDYEYSPGLRAIQDKYGAGNVGPWDDWHWGYVNGHLSALRWMLGEDFDFLDT